MVELAGELVARRIRRRRDFILAPVAHPQFLPLVAGGRFHLDAALVAHQQELVAIGRIHRHARTDHARRKLQLEFDHVLDVAEARIGPVGGFLGIHRHRFLARHVARRLQRVNADIHQRAAARHRFFGAPVVATRGVTMLGTEIAQFADRARSRQPPRLEIERLEVAAVANHQFFAGLLAGGDHRFALDRRQRHRLFAQHVLASLGAADRVLGVHRHWQADVDDVDLRIVLDAVVVLVIVDIRFRHAILARHFFGLDRVAADQRDQLAVLAILELRDDDAEPVAAEAHDRVAELAVGIGPHGAGHGRCRQHATSGHDQITPSKIHHRLSPLLVCLSDSVILVHMLALQSISAMARAINFGRGARGLYTLR